MLAPPSPGSAGTPRWPPSRKLRTTAIRAALAGHIHLPEPEGQGQPASHTPEGLIADADLGIALGDAPVPDHGGQHRPPGITAIGLSLAKTTRLATRYTTGLISRARLAFALAWSHRRRRHQAIAHWHHYNTRLLAAADTG